jgi:proteasome lid subunit RPN8/RPN11
MSKIRKTQQEKLESNLVIDSPQTVSQLNSGVPLKETLEILIYQHALEEIKKHTASDLKNEVGGVMLGEAYKYYSRTFVEITGSIPALEAKSGAAHVEFTNETWEKMEQERAARYNNKRVVGWYHTHPGFGLFMSPADVFIHTQTFHQPFQVALVLDPVHENFKFFKWTGKEIAACPTFSIRIKEDSLAGKSVFEQVLHYIKVLETTLELETNYDNLKKTLTALREDFSGKTENRILDRYDLLEVMVSLARLDSLVIREAEFILSRRYSKLRKSIVHK